MGDRKQGKHKDVAGFIYAMRLIVACGVFLIAILGFLVQEHGKNSEYPPSNGTQNSTVSNPSANTGKPTDTTASSTNKPTLKKPQKSEGVSKLKVHFIDVGQADSILIECDQEFMLVDGGNNDDKDTIIDYLNKQGVKKLKYVVATHPHEDHIGALDNVIETFDVGKIFAPYIEHTSKTYYNLLEAVALKNLKMTQPKVNSQVSLGGSTVTFLAPNKDYGTNLNNWSVGLKITNGVHTFVMCGDAETEAEADIVAAVSDLKADVLKLGHHGSSSSSSDAFLDAIDPEYAVISCGTDNKYGHPHRETLEKLSKRNIRYFRTDLQGTIVAESDGKTLSWNTDWLN